MQIPNGKRSWYWHCAARRHTLALLLFGSLQLSCAGGSQRGAATVEFYLVALLALLPLCLGMLQTSLLRDPMASRARHRELKRSR